MAINNKAHYCPALDPWADMDERVLEMRGCQHVLPDRDPCGDVNTLGTLALVCSSDCGAVDITSGYMSDQLRFERKAMQAATSCAHTGQCPVLCLIKREGCLS